MDGTERELYQWEIRLLKMVDRVDRREGPEKRTTKSVSFATPPEVVQLMHVAAEERGISLAGYATRALARQLAEDLELPVEAILGFTPMPLAYGNANFKGKPLAERPPDNGKGFGEWSWS